MLYVNTRNRADSFTAHRVLHEQYAPDGGLFVPFRLPVFSEDEVHRLQHQSFGECVAHIINLLFGTELNGRDVDLLIGLHPVRLTMMPHRIVVCESWHNVDADYSFIEKTIYHRISSIKTNAPTDWAKIAIRIAVLFGVYSELGRNGVHLCDIALPVGDFSTPIAAWYARKMGLGLGTIIIGSNENSATWDLIYRGEINTGCSVVNTNLPGLDYAYPSSVERLIYETLGLKEAQRYANTCAQGGIFKLAEEPLAALNNGIASAVVSSKRTDTVIASLYRSNGYIADGYTAVAYGALQDYRATTGESRTTLLLSDSSPIHAVDSVSRNLGMTREELRRKL